MINNRPSAVISDDLFGYEAANPPPAIYVTKEKCRQETKQENPTHDTCEISVIYMQRHRYMSRMGLGQWFDNAHGLEDEELHWAVTALEAKRLIVKKGYNRLSLNVLADYNNGIGKDE